MTSDIDLEGEKIDAGGSGTSSSFKGTFDGDGYSIKNCTVKTSSFNNGFPYVGLFGRNEGTIKNLVLDNIICLTNGLVLVNSSNISLSVGIVTGYNAGVIYNCQVKNSSVRVSADIKRDDSSLNVGGVAGLSEGLIEYCAFTKGNIYGIATKGKGKVNVGGIAGTLAGSKVLESYVSLSDINAHNDNTKFTLGGIVGSMVTRIAQDSSTISPKLSMCLVYCVTKNKNGESFGYIAGKEIKGEFSNCYYAALKEESVSGEKKSNCIRKDSLSMSVLPSVFYESWTDGTDGPVLQMHTK